MADGVKLRRRVLISDDYDTTKPTKINPGKYNKVQDKSVQVSAGCE